MPGRKESMPKEDRQNRPDGPRGGSNGDDLRSILRFLSGAPGSKPVSDMEEQLSLLKSALLEGGESPEADEALVRYALAGGIVPCSVSESWVKRNAWFADGYLRVGVVKRKGAEELRHELGEMASRFGHSGSTGRVLAVGDDAVVIACSAAPGSPEDLAGLVGDLLADPAGFALGTSEATPHFDLLSVLYEHAAFAAGRALRDGRAHYPFEQLAFDYLVSTTDIAEEFARLGDMRVLGLFESDRERGSDLLNTVIAYIESGFSLSRTAAGMHLHRNSVVYRLNRVAEYSGIDLLATERDYDTLTLLLTCKMYRDRLDKGAVPREWVPSC